MERHSRSEYNITRGKFRKQFVFALEFKTTASEGILFYVTNPNDQDYVAIFLQNGHVSLLFDSLITY